MLILVNGIVIDPRNMKCNRINRDGSNCGNTCGDKGVIEIATIDDIIKTDVTCGTHINVRAGDDVRFRVRMDAIQSASLVDSVTTKSI